MSARKTINLKRTELHYLRNRVVAKYVSDEKRELNLNSNRNSYFALKRIIEKKLKGKVLFYISEYLLFKLYYETRYSTEASFNVDFINTLYLYITEAKKNRYDYFNISKQRTTSPQDETIDIIKQQYEVEKHKRRKIEFPLELFYMWFQAINRNKNRLVLISGLCFAVVSAIHFSTIKNVNHNHTGNYWVCKYEDGTKIWFRFNESVNHQFAKNYFEGKFSVKRIKCDAFKMLNNTRIPVCYDKALARQYISEFGKVRCVYRE